MQCPAGSTQGGARILERLPEAGASQGFQADSSRADRGRQNERGQGSARWCLGSEEICPEQHTEWGGRCW